MVVSILKEALIQIVRSKNEDYLIKKIGERIIPIIGAASAIYDAPTSDDGNNRIRHAVACALLAIKGQTGEDVEIAAMVVAPIRGSRL